MNGKSFQTRIAPVNRKRHPHEIWDALKLKCQVLVLMLLVTLSHLEAQDKFSVTGYLSTMQSSMFDSLTGPFINENLIHNRLNFKGYLGKNIVVAAEFRNRLFMGDLVRMGTYYSDLIGYDNGWADMSWNIAREPSFLINSTLDRIWIDYSQDKWQITAGRQRINWGQTLVWNPNDIFNTYSFFDFDYIERPGSDALRLQYFPSAASSAEMAAKIEHSGDLTLACMYRFNKWGYDLQFLAGIVKEMDLVIGAGWSGSIKKISFRGEASLFTSYRNYEGKKSTVLLTTGFDRIFKDNSVAQVQIMYGNNPLDISNFNSFYTGSLTTKDLAFSNFSAFGQYIWAATPLINLSVSAMWLPDLDGYFSGSSLDVSLAENLDFSLIWQHFNSLIAEVKTNLNIGFLRVKFSF